MSVFDNPKKLADALVKHGLVPGNCRLAEVVFAPMKATIIRYEVTVTRQQTAALAKALAEASEEVVA